MQSLRRELVLSLRTGICSECLQNSPSSVVVLFCFVSGFFLSPQIASSGAQQLFYAVPRETAELGICTFCKAILYGNCKQYIYLSIVCANESLIGSLTLSVSCLKKKVKTLQDPLCVSNCVCLTIFGHVVLLLC